MNDIILKIENKNENLTVGKLLRNDLKLSGSLVKKLKQSGGILINDSAVTVRYRVKYGDILKLRFPQSRSINVVPMKIPLDIVYEDDDILIVNKPKNMPVHPASNNYYNTLGNAVVYYYKNSPFVYRPVNRLDRYTSGLVVIAKNQNSAFNLSGQIKSNAFEKTYLAITKGVPEPMSGVIDNLIGREPESTIKRHVCDDGKRAVTRYEVIDKSDGNALVIIKLQTGRTHQIRVHMAYIGCPLLYDFLYGEEVTGESYYLHCSELSFFQPTTGEKLEFISKPDFEGQNFKTE